MSTAAFRNAILCGDLIDVQRCLANGCRANEPLDEELPLTIAIRSGEEEVAVHLICNGADLSLAPAPVEPKEISIHQTTGASYSARNLGVLVISGLSLQLAINTVSYMACKWLLELDYWPTFVKPLLRPIYGQSTFDFHMAFLIVDAFRAGYLNILSPRFLQPAKYIPLYFAMFLSTPSMPAVDFQPVRLRFRSDLFARLFDECLKVTFWQLKGFGLFVMQEFLWQTGVLYFKAKNTKNEIAPREYGGSSAIRAIVKYEGGTDKVAYAILKAGMLSEADVLRAAQQEPDRESNDVLRLWTWAVCNGHHRIVQELLDLGLPVTQSGLGYRWDAAAIELAAYHGHQAVVEILIKCMMSKDLVPSQLLDKAMLAGTTRLCEYGLPDQAKVAQFNTCCILLPRMEDIDIKDQKGRTCLSFAVEANNIALVELLLGRNADVNLADKDGETPLLYLQHLSNWRPILNALLHAGANVNHVANDGDTILLKHAAWSNTEVVRALLDACAKPMIVNRNGTSALHFAARYTMTEMMQNLLDAGAEVDSLDESCETPLLKACHCHYLRAPALRLLLNNGAKANVFDKEGMAPLLRVCDLASYGPESSNYTDYVHSIEALIKCGANVNETHSGTRFYKGAAASPLGIVAGKCHLKETYPALRAFLGAGASVNGLSREGLPALVSVCQDSPRVGSEDHTTRSLELLLDNGADIHYRDDDGMSLLHHATDNANFGALKVLLDRDMPVNDPDLFGRTPLHLACANTWWMLTGTYKQWDAAGGYSGCEEYANWHCSMSSSFTIYGLLGHEASASEQDIFGCTAADIAAKAGNPRVMAMLLLQAGAILLYDFPDHQERLPFHHAVNSPEVTRLLLHYHSTHKVLADRYWQVIKPNSMTFGALKKEMVCNVIEGTNKSRYQKNHPNELINETTHPLSWRRGLCNAKDKYGNTPLHYAALLGSTEVVKQYLEMPDVNPAACNINGETPLDYSLENRDCGLAIAGKLRELGITFEDDGRSFNESRSESRREAEIFVAALQKEYSYGAYPLDRE